MPVALVTGANRGLGLEFTRQYLDAGWQVLAACRNPESSDALAALASDGLTPVAIDVTDHETIARAVESLAEQSIDVLINNAGVFGPNSGQHNDWRQTFGHMDYDIWADVIRINTMGPFRMAEAFIGNVANSEQKKLITISSNMGSIGDPEKGQHFAYRTSKAAVNMAMATLADALAPQEIIVALLDPGWCRTDMGGGGADYDPAESVKRMRGIIDELTIGDTGRFLRHDGYEHPW